MTFSQSDCGERIYSTVDRQSYELGTPQPGSCSEFWHLVRSTQTSEERYRDTPFDISRTLQTPDCGDLRSTFYNTCSAVVGTDHGWLHQELQNLRGTRRSRAAQTAVDLAHESVRAPHVSKLEILRRAQVGYLARNGASVVTFCRRQAFVSRLKKVFVW